MNNIKQLVEQFRDAIEEARDAGEFNNDFTFKNFPLGCCGDTCDLLGYFLMKKHIRTDYVWGTYRDGSFENKQSHAWILTKNKTIIDITGDQFKHKQLFLNYDKSVYVGNEDDFHRLFEVEDMNIHENIGFDDFGNPSKLRLKELYSKIVKYI